MPTERELRAARRRTWPGRLVRDQEPAQLDTPETRLASMWQLALDAWAASGRPLPEYPRSAIPGRLIRR
ncbi:MAG: hypothetical protein H6738_17125 [Alphaproteobacteria bacterium]|nr:hypothetical protein [Alphaproteobacteria bacterium]